MHSGFHRAPEYKNTAHATWGSSGGVVVVGLGVGPGSGLGADPGVVAGVSTSVGPRVGLARCPTNTVSACLMAMPTVLRQPITISTSPFQLQRYGHVECTRVEGKD